MSDNTQLEAAVIPGDILATDDVAGVKFQRVKLALGADGAHDLDVDSGQQAMASSVPVVIASDQTVIPVSDNGGSLTIDGAVDTELPAAAALADNTANPTAPAVGAFPHLWDGAAWDRMPGNSASGVLVQGAVTVSGTVSVTEPVSVDDNGGSLTIDNAELVAIAASVDGVEASLTTLIGHVDGVEGQLTTITGHVDGVEGLLTTIDGDTGNIATATAAIQVSGEIIDDWDEADRCKVNPIVGQAGVQAGAGAVSATTQRVVLATDDLSTVSLALLDDVVKTDDAAFTPAVDKVAMVGATFDDAAPDSVNEGDAGALRMSANRNLYTQVRDAAGNERGLNVDANGEIGIGAIRTSVTPGTAAANLGKAEDAGHNSGDVGVMALAVANEGNTARGADNDYTPIAVDTEGNVRVVGNRDHDAVDAGEVLKVGSRATDYEPDTDDTESGGLAEVAEGDRVALSLNRRGELIEGVNTKRVSLSALNATYDDSPTTNVSASEECWNYRWATLSYTIDSTNTPTDIRFDVEVSLDGTNFAKLMNGPLGLLIYDDVATATAISRSLTFPIGAYLIQVRVTCTGTTASNTFAVTNAMLFLRN